MGATHYVSCCVFVDFPIEAKSKADAEEQVHLLPAEKVSEMVLNGWPTDVSVIGVRAVQ